MLTCQMLGIFEVDLFATLSASDNVPSSIAVNNTTTQGNIRSEPNSSRCVG